MKKEGTPYVNERGNVIWKNVEGQYHRHDGPAVERPNGTKAWWIGGVKYTEEEWREKINQLKNND